MSKQEVKVGQVWAHPGDGAKHQVVGFSKTKAYVRVRRLGEKTVFGYALHSFAERWTLVQDVPKAAGRAPVLQHVSLDEELFAATYNDALAAQCAPADVSTKAQKIDKSAERVDEVYKSGYGCKACGMTGDEYEYNGQRWTGRPCPGCSAPTNVAPFQQDPCSALRGTLPKSEHVIEENTPGYQELVPGAVDAARTSLRRKVASMREWPCCPVSKEPLSIEANVRLEEKDHLGIDMGSKRWETVRFWQAAFTCRTCGGGR